MQTEKETTANDKNARFENVVSYHVRGKNYLCKTYIIFITIILNDKLRCLTKRVFKILFLNGQTEIIIAQVRKMEFHVIKLN